MYRIAGNIGREFVLVNWRFAHTLPNYDPPILLCHMYSDVIHCDATKIKNVNIKISLELPNNLPANISGYTVLVIPKRCGISDTYAIPACKTSAQSAVVNAYFNLIVFII